MGRVGLTCARLVGGVAVVASWASCPPQAVAQIQYLDNGAIRLGVDTTKGGAIVALQPSGTLGSGSNVVNTFDLGRLVQQSYYSGPSSFVPAGATQHPSWSPWPWNPVQGGDAYGNRSTLISASNSGTQLYVKSRPKQWALANVDSECTMEQWITLSGSVATVRNRLTNARDDTAQYAARTQELPAVYTWARLTQLKTYAGTAPFTSGSLTTIPNAAPPWTTFRATEGWAAYVDSNDWGLGVFAPGNVKFIGGFSGTPGTGSTTSANTGYIAPIRQEVIDHDIVYEHTYHLILGSLASIRSYAVANKPDLRPDYQFRGTRDGWTYANATDAGFPVTDRLHVNVNSADPQMLGPECSFAAADVPKLYVRVAASVASGTQTSGRFYWERDNGAAPMSTSQSQGFTITADGQFRTYEVGLSATSTWSGQISRLRFDPVSSGTTGDFVEVQFISAYAPGTIWVDVVSGTQTQAEARASILTGTAGLTKTGAGVLSLTLSNTFTGRTRVDGGRLLVSHTAALVRSTVDTQTGATGTVAFGAITSATFGGLTGSNGMALINSGSAAVTLSVGGNGESTVFAGRLSGGGSLTKTGSGALTLTGSSSHTGVTRVTAGRLVAAHSAALASSTASVSAGATLAVGGGVQVSVRGLQFATGSRVDVDAGDITVAGGLAANALVGKILEGRAGGTWTGTSGVVSTAVAAAVAAGASRAVGWVDEGGGSLRFGYAAPGDTNVDGFIDVLDGANLLNSGRYDRGTAATWTDGDFNYDGIVDVMDAAEFVTSGLYDAGGYGPAGLAAVAAVPEPGPCLSLIAAGCGAAAVRRLRGSPRRGGLLSF
ncbi:MAG: autotransporter-associated beta strand repeat-containing protein [Planctomycetaceae bacterium]